VLFCKCDYAFLWSALPIEAPSDASPAVVALVIDSERQADDDLLLGMTDFGDVMMPDLVDSGQMLKQLEELEQRVSLC